jgi:hypothetical protein
MPLVEIYRIIFKHISVLFFFILKTDELVRQRYQL